ncbi:MAG: serine/threonine protein kinase [bacterium]|nr:serine/threonine protein kinase [bacterium]
MSQTGADSDWVRARETFLDLADADEKERAVALAELAREDPELCKQVERLLAQDAASAPAEQRVGPFVLLDRIGEGGFGTVYRARQEEPIVREVALKILKPGLKSPQFIARFADERKFLARIDHPDVVKILDAGAAEDGRLYVTMELVHGEPITTFVKEHDLALEERVALLQRVARAVHHVHQRAVIHRDLKPSNIMVTVVDGEPRPRIIDFGIATAVSEADRSGWTRIAGPMFTPSFASPEQVAGSDSIDIRADVYALGGVLCELLTGARPRERVTATETAARAPSTLVAADDESSVAERSLRGDLDRIVLKCVAWEPDERYDSAAALADDLGRYLRHEPIQATPPSRLYLARKFARRNRLTVAAAAVALLAVIAGLVLAIDGRSRAVLQSRLALAAQKNADDEADRARTEGQRAEDSLSDAIAAIDEMLRQGSDRDLAQRPGNDPAQRKLVQGALELYEKMLKREEASPKLTSRVIVAQVRVARLRREIGELEESVAASRRALELCDELEAGSTVDELRADALFALAVSLHDLGRLTEFAAVEADLMAVPISSRERVAMKQSHRCAIVRGLSARILVQKGDVDGALDLLADVIATRESLVEQQPEDTLLVSGLGLAIASRAYFGGFYSKIPNYAELFERGVARIESALEIDADDPGLEHRLAKVLSNWAHTDVRLESPEPAIPRAQRGSEILSRLVGEFPQRENYLADYLVCAQRLSWAHRLSGDTERAEQVMQVAIELGLEARERMPGTDAVLLTLAMLQSELAYRVGERDELERAGALWAGASKAWETLISRPQPQLRVMIQIGTFYDNLSRYQSQRGELETSEATARTAREWHERMLARTNDDEHRNRLGKTLPFLADVQVRRGRLDEAVETLRDAIEGGFIDGEVLALAAFDALRERVDFAALARTEPD